MARSRRPRSATPTACASAWSARGCASTGCARTRGGGCRSRASPLQLERVERKADGHGPGCRPMPENVTIGRAVLRIVVGALCVAAAMACFALLSGSVDDTDWKVIGTSLLVALASATAGAGLGARPERPLLGTLTV